MNKDFNEPFLPDTKEPPECSHHLDKSTISAFLAEKLGEPEQTIIKQIIENCPRCKEKAEKIAKDFELLEKNELFEFMKGDKNS